jgi:hypothetical protein
MRRSSHIEDNVLSSLKRHRHSCSHDIVHTTSVVKKLRVEENISNTKSDEVMSTEGVKVNINVKSKVKKVPDFSKMHKKQFNSQKSLTDVVTRVSFYHSL